MVWFKLDDTFHDNHKVSALATGPCETQAVFLWAKSASWSSLKLQAGFVPDGIAVSFSKHPSAAAELVRVGLWIRDDDRGGYVFHDWEDYNPSGARIEQKRAMAAARKAKHRAKLAAAKVAASETSDSEEQQSDCQKVGKERVPVGPERAGNAHAALGDRERDRETSSSSRSEDLLLTDHVTTGTPESAVANDAAPLRLASRRERPPLPEPPPNEVAAHQRAEESRLKELAKAKDPDGRQADAKSAGSAWKAVCEVLAFGRGYEQPHKFEAAGSIARDVLNATRRFGSDAPIESILRCAFYAFMRDKRTKCKRVEFGWILEGDQFTYYLEEGQSSNPENFRVVYTPIAGEAAQ